jgi:hypothetical protein
MQQVERVWPRRLRWRLAGAWMWPAFALLTVVDGFVLALLPFYGEGPGGFVPALLLAGFLNLLVVAVFAPLGGRVLRRRRPDLPRLVASDYAGAWMLATIAALLLAGGIVHRPSVAATGDDERAVGAAVHDYVLAQAREYRGGLDAIDAMRLEPDYYRACVPGADPRRWLCLFVGTDQRPAGVTRDTDQAPNSVYRRHGGFS